MPSVKPRIHPKSKNVEPFDRMLRRFKKGCEKSDIINEVKKREHFEKPSDKKKRDHKAAVRRNLMQQREDEL
mgnify:CR=1 FL=1